MRSLRTAFMIFLFLPVIATGKKKYKYTAKDLINISDSLLRSKIGDTLFRYCKFDNSSYYTYQKGSKQRFELLNSPEKLPKRFNKAFIRYDFLMPYGECIEYDTISGVLSLVLQKYDTVFSFESDPDISFIPATALAHETCKFISKEEAIKIALQDTLQQGVNPPYAILRYLPESKQFSWVVLSLLWDEKNFHNEREAVKDMVLINAISGDILKHSAIPYTQDLSEIY